MNENIDLTKILKDCPKGFKLYSLLHGEVSFRGIDETTDDYSISYDYPITNYRGMCMCTSEFYLTCNGTYSNNYDGDCLLFPSKDQRDWSKFTTPWYKKEKFDPKTLVPFTKVLILKDLIWMPTMFTFLDFSLEYPRMRYNTIAVKVIPYNDDTKHLAGKANEAPKYYRYWEE